MRLIWSCLGVTWTPFISKPILLQLNYLSFSSISSHQLKVSCISLKYCSMNMGSQNFDTMATIMWRIGIRMIGLNGGVDGIIRAVVDVLHHAFAMVMWWWTNPMTSYDTAIIHQRAMNLRIPKNLIYNKASIGTQWTYCMRWFFLERFEYVNML